MSETWQPMQILNPNQNVYYKSTKSIIDELGQLITISSNLFKIILVWKDSKLGIKNMRHILRTINKLMGSYHLSTKTESLCGEKMLKLDDYWDQMIQHVNIENVVKEEEIITYDGLPISFEVTCISILNQLIYQYSSNGGLVEEAIELSFNIVQIHHSRIQVSNIVPFITYICAFKGIDRLL